MKPPKEQALKRPLKQISQVEEPQQDASLESAHVYCDTKGVKLSGKRTEKGWEDAALFCPF